MINLAPWYYRKLLADNEILNNPEFFQVKLLNDNVQYEAVISLKDSLRPSWLSFSEIYRNCDGSGTDHYKNIAVYKAISEALERYAFYETIDTNDKEFCFDINPTTTGMAAFPHFSFKHARNNAKAEAVERWAIHEFNRMNLPVIEHQNGINKLKHYEIKTPYKDIAVSLIAYEHSNFYAYGFAGGQHLDHSFQKALIELDRNIRVLEKYLSKEKKHQELKAAVDKTLSYFSTREGNEKFEFLIKNAPRNLKKTTPKILCDKEIRGKWSDYTVVWRFLIEDSYFECSEDPTFFMF